MQDLIQKKEYQKNWYQKNKEKVKQKSREWQKQNKELRKKYCREWARKNKKYKAKIKNRYVLWDEKNNEIYFSKYHEIMIFLGISKSGVWRFLTTDKKIKGWQGEQLL